MVDGNLVTGQNQNAGPMVAREMMQILAAATATQKVSKRHERPERTPRRDHRPGLRHEAGRDTEFPSKAAFMAVVTDPSRLEAQKDHREVAIADTYTIIVRAGIDDLAASIDA